MNIEDYGDWTVTFHGWGKAFITPGFHDKGCYIVDGQKIIVTRTKFKSRHIFLDWEWFALKHPLAIRFVERVYEY